MYELTCPACSHKVDRPFVRLGARAACEDCGHRFQILSEHMVRQVTLPPEESTEDNPLLLGGSKGKPPPPATASRGGSRAAGSAASESPAAASGTSAPAAPAGAATRSPATRAATTETNAEPAAPAGPAPAATGDPTLHTPPSPPPSPTVAKMIAQRRAARRRRQYLILLLVGGLLLTLMLVMLLVWYVTRGDNDTDAGATDSAGRGVTDASSLPPDLTLCSAEPLSRDNRWLSIDESKPAPDTDSRLTVSGVKLTRQGDRRTLVAELAAAGPDLVELAMLRLMLVGTNQRVFAYLDMPMMLVGGSDTAADRKRLNVVVAVPPELAGRATDALGRASVSMVIPGGAMFHSIIVKPVTRTDHTLLQVTAYNPLDRPLQRAVFCVMARSAGDQTLGQWRVIWTLPVGPRERVEFAVQVPLGDPNVQWSVLGAAEARRMFGPGHG
ncbi:MAG: hypothetical protein IT440_10865 [Phycisphaeraceae bacterium]|nr:hypothetical protein [Phycisphaeraceae bacterium]